MASLRDFFRKTKAKNADGATSRFLRRNWQVAYAVVLIVTVPVAISLNTIYAAKRFQATVDAELQRTALIIGNLFEVAAEAAGGDATFANRARLQELVRKTAATVTEVRTLDVLEKDGDDFTVIASTNEARPRKTTCCPQPTPPAASATGPWSCRSAPPRRTRRRSTC